MGYNVYMTKAGFALQAKLFAEGGDLEITRVEVGSGRVMYALYNLLLQR